MAGLSEDPNVPFSFTEEAWSPEAAGGDGPQVREADTAQVFDLTAMIAGLENDPDARKRTLGQGGVSDGVRCWHHRRTAHR